MALATKCPHCNTTFRVAHDQLKLRGGIVRCGSCNEVFDGNAALLEPVAAPQPAILPPPTPLPVPTSFDQKMAALDTRAAEVLSSDQAEPIYTLELDTALADEADPALDVEPVEEPQAAAEPAQAPEALAEPEPERVPEMEPGPVANFDDEPIAAPAPFALPVEPAVLPSAETPLDLDLDIEPEPEPEPESEPDPQPEIAPSPDSSGRIEPQWDAEPTAQPGAEAPLEDALNIESMSHEELEAALEAELAAMDQSFAAEQDQAPLEDPANGRREPTMDDASFDTAAAPSAAADFSAPPPLREDELDDVDEEALVQLSSAGLASAESARAQTYLQAKTDDATDTTDVADEQDSNDQESDEPGFVKRDRRRQKFGKAATIAMSLGSLLLVAALAGQAVTTFRNQIAAAVPPFKPALLAACNALGCKIELPTQIDDLTIEQGELQTLSDTTFSFTTLLRNQSATAQSWPHIELVLDDAADKKILRRVFTPRDYLDADVAIDKGFAPHTEQSVKLYFELKELKASGYHIAVFYP